MGFQRDSRETLSPIKYPLQLLQPSLRNSHTFPVQIKADIPTLQDRRLQQGRPRSHEWVQHHITLPGPRFDTQLGQQVNRSASLSGFVFW